MAGDTATVVSTEETRRNDSDETVTPNTLSGEKRQLTEETALQFLGFGFPNKKKWLIITAVFIVQVSMNFNAAIFANAVPGMMKEFEIDHWMASVGQMIFLVSYAFGCELWAPFSEELGRKWVLQGSLFLVNVWNVSYRPV